MVWVLIFAALAVVGLHYDQELANRTFLSAEQVRNLALVAGAALLAIRFGFWFWKG